MFQRMVSKMKNNKLTDAILGFVVGDALGVPVEFMRREDLDINPVKDMRGYGTYNQPPGTWSDDTSMTIATLAALNNTDGIVELIRIMRHFQEWLNEGCYTPYGTPFDVGNTTARAIQTGKPQDDEQDNGNGALMRMLPIVFLPLPIEEKIKAAREVGALTHAHEISMLSCELFVEIADKLIRGVENWRMSDYGLSSGIFWRIPKIDHFTRNGIKSTGYVIDTLEAALWCLETTKGYKSCVLAAVNLGGDTDTIAAIAGGLAGIRYGREAIPDAWLKQISRLDYILDVCAKAEKWSMA